MVLLWYICSRILLNPLFGHYMSFSYPSTGYTRDTQTDDCWIWTAWVLGQGTDNYQTKWIGNEQWVDNHWRSYPLVVCWQFWTSIKLPNRYTGYQWTSAYMYRIKWIWTFEYWMINGLPYMVSVTHPFPQSVTVWQGLNPEQRYYPAPNEGGHGSDFVCSFPHPYVHYIFKFLHVPAQTIQGIGPKFVKLFRHKCVKVQSLLLASFHAAVYLVRCHCESTCGHQWWMTQLHQLKCNSVIHYGIDVLSQKISYVYIVMILQQSDGR